MSSAWFPRRLTATQLEERRLQAAAWFRDGTLTQAEIAGRLGVTAAAVSRWRAQWRHGGDRRLVAHPRRGHPARLTEAEWRRLLRRLARGAVAAGFDTEQWTLTRMARVIAREFGVPYHPRYLARPLPAHGWSPQRPATQANEREEALVEAWLRRDWEAVQRGLVAQGTRLPAWTKRVTRFGPA